MPVAQQITGDVQIVGTLAVTGGITGQRREGITEETGRTYSLPFQNFRIWDAFQTPIATAATDDLGITAGAFGTGCPYIISRELNAGGAITGYARTMFQLPPEYVAGGAVAVRLAAGMLLVVAGTTATADVECYVAARDTLKSGSDLCSTAAQSINSLTFANKDFTIDGSGLSPGSLLDLRIALIVNSATASSHFAAIAAAEVILTVKG